MAQEHVFQDFSGGMNALAAVDKLDPKECLLAENIRLDETGNIQSAGAITRQNSASYEGTNVHSLYWNPSLGGVAGVGQDVFQGPTLGGLAVKLAGQNTNGAKMSFISAPGRVYFDVGNVGYWSDLTNLLTVDWAPPSASSAVTTGPNTSTTTGGTATNFGFALGTQNMQGVQVAIVATETLFNTSTTAVGTATVTYTGKMIVGGVPVGTATTISRQLFGQPGQTTVSTNTYVFGNANYLFGDTSLTPAQVNAANFGFQFAASFGLSGGASNLIVALGVASVTAYQSASGFVAATGAAGLLSGTYTWKFTFVGVNGEESDASVASASIVLASQQGTLTAIPPGDARTGSRNVYRKGGALTSYYLVGSVPDNVTTTFSDGQTDLAALTAGIILAGDVPGDYPNSRLGGTQVHFPAYHYDRTFWIVDGSNQIIWSKPLNGFAYPSINFLNVGDSKPCKRIISIFGELIIIKTDSIWRLTGTDESSFDLSQTPSSVGTDESWTVAALPDKIIFHNRWGFWVFNGYTSQPLTPKLDLWMKQEDRTGKSLFGVNGFHPPEVVSASVPLLFESVANSEKYYFAYAEAGQTKNNAVLVFDLKHGNITKRTAGALSLAIDPVNGYVYMGDASGFVSLLDDWNGTGGANFDFQHGYQDVQRGSNKTLWALEFYLNTNGQTLTPYVYYDNGIASETLAPISTTNLQRVVRPCEASQARKMQNFSFRLNGSLSKVNASGTPTVQIVHVKALFDIRTGRARTGQ